ncbi:restriction endonuclease subunit S (plasmid) [Salmonella enterica subsp. enterica serovar Adelaide]|nr:restriction endonuclease subunit S [Salmonella enterica]EBU7211309.1 restriction endonuclease subunit S [Salmonella enterica subsp. enterica serovar Ohio]ECF3831762.1 restriction endonuclease subunit S [Salmonella enterica subsp. enterica serovar Braenderup]WGP04362.1 restriction endonuclease subunit S [Salmonella enterica subsp. enterica serovar Adelaide]ECJ7942175.1 restriction endonuclease subunit S [Salmonella enterica]
MSSVNFLEKLLDGVEVEWKTLGQTCKIETGKLNANAAVDDGEYMFFTTAKETSKIDKFRWDTEALLIAGNANVGEVKHYIGKFEAYQRTYVLTNFDEKVSVRFLYFVLSYSLKKYLEERTNSAAMTYIVLSTLENFPIPIPCPGNPQKSLAIQSEIVRILDKFTALTAELTAELTARKKQYNYYRDRLLSFEEGEVEWKTLGELAENLDAKRKPITSGLRETGSIPYYGASGIVDYVKDYIFDGDFLLVSEDGANLLARNTPIAFSISGKAWVNNHAHVLRFNSYAERRYIEYYLNSIDLTPYISGAAQPKLNKKNLECISIPNPSPTDKIRIVAILDKFDTLTGSISEGLPREIELRQKQYEYYRDLLFSFPKPDSVTN